MQIMAVYQQIFSFFQMICFCFYHKGNHNEEHDVSGKLGPTIHQFKHVGKISCGIRFCDMRLNAKQSCSQIP